MLPVSHDMKIFHMCLTLGSFRGDCRQRQHLTHYFDISVRLHRIQGFPQANG
jgi:hypothetical protein